LQEYRYNSIGSADLSGLTVLISHLILD